MTSNTFLETADKKEHHHHQQQQQQKHQQTSREMCGWWWLVCVKITRVHMFRYARAMNNSPGRESRRCILSSAIISSGSKRNVVRAVCIGASGIERVIYFGVFDGRKNACISSSDIPI